MIDPAHVISTKTIHFDDPAKFLDAICRRSVHLPSQRAAVSNWMFRGQAQNNWSLIPIGLRDPNNILDRLFCSKRDNSWHQICFEAKVLTRFFEFADGGGLVIPEDSHDFRTWLYRFASEDHRQDLLKGEEEWPHWSVLSLLAIAQHYGVPTRLLDWTWNPFTAAYFAARDAANRQQKAVGEQSKDLNLAVWAFSSEWLRFAKNATPHCSQTVSWFPWCRKGCSGMASHVFGCRR